MRHWSACKGKMYLGLRRNGLMVSDAGFQDFFSAPYAGFGNVCRRFAAWVFSDSLFARVMDGAVFFCGGFIRYFFVRCWLFGLCRCLFFVVLVWVSAICFLSYLEDGFSMCLCPYLERTQSRQPFRLAHDSSTLSSHTDAPTLPVLRTCSWLESARERQRLSHKHG